jgi:hypothetical protein
MRRRRLVREAINHDADRIVIATNARSRTRS